MDDTILKAELDINDITDLLSSITVWEKEFEDETSWNKMILEMNPEDMPFPVPEEIREKFDEVLEDMRKKARRRVSVLSDKAPKRFEQAAMLKAKLIMIKRKTLNKLTDQLCEEPKKQTETT